MTGAVQAIIRSSIGADVGSALVRIRAIIPSIGNGDGRLALHMEKTAVQFPGVHVIWTPLVPPGIVTNYDAPGLRFRIGSEFFIPKMRTGDLAIFNGSIEHGTFVPDAARHWRVGCDIRIFPWTETNHLPPEAIAMGQRPERLVWP